MLQDRRPSCASSQAASCAASCKVRRAGSSFSCDFTLAQRAQLRPSEPPRIPASAAEITRISSFTAKAETFSHIHNHPKISYLCGKFPACKKKRRNLTRGYWICGVILVTKGGGAGTIRAMDPLSTNLTRRRSLDRRSPGRPRDQSSLQTAWEYSLSRPDVHAAEKQT